MRKDLLRISLWSMLVMLFGGSLSAKAQDVTATWDWQNKIPETIVNVNIQGANEGDVASNVEGISLHVISNGGKLQYNSSGYAQFNANTTIQVPVKNAGDVVTVVSYPGQSNYTVGGEDATGQNTFEYTAKASDATKKYVEIVPTRRPISTPSPWCRRLPRRQPRWRTKPPRLHSPSIWVLTARRLTSATMPTTSCRARWLTVVGYS